jgi:hypothetical protein
MTTKANVVLVHGTFADGSLPSSHVPMLSSQAERVAEHIIKAAAAIRG